MIASDFKKLFDRDLDRLMTELDAYPNEKSLWIKVDGINNTAGNLFMHLSGNLQHFIGAILAESSYERNREFEFNGKVSFNELMSEVEKTKQVLADYFQSDPSADYQEVYPLQPFGYPMTTRYFLIHLHSHLNYHLGQINYHRRILSKTSK
ncbi:DinB family protein [Ekhidna sp. To15]|uniref:DinB family protein n=1 Tax=Ekhidna sp. To15 TaxID=3395267 RepID=UPI003F520F23